MSIYDINNIGELIKDNSYVGRGIITGKSADGKAAVFAYFIMGRSENSRNRVFVENGDEVIIHPYDASKVADPSLIIYSPVRKINKSVIVTNGDQTDTVYNYISNGDTFANALETRCFEPDSPNFTPRISAILDFDKDFRYSMSILKSGDAEGSICNRYLFNYTPVDGLGHFIHTYNCDGNPIPTFTGEPERVAIPSCIDTFTNDIWDNLNKPNRISLYVRYINLETFSTQNRLINSNK